VKREAEEEWVADYHPWTCPHRPQGRLALLRDDLGKLRLSTETRSKNLKVGALVQKIVLVTVTQSLQLPSDWHAGVIAN
jgi:hypothetical protein